MSSVTFLNHSCLAVASSTTKILCDPWFTGSAFDNGWRLLYEGSHDLGKLDYDWLWISHEHPDHFSIPTLKQIADRRSRIIYQRTSDQKVRNYLSRSHEVFELGDFERKTFGDIDCQLYLSDGYDSAMLFALPDGATVLNLNDCRVELGGVMDAIAKTTGPVDLVAVQFSYANWAGNRGDDAIPAYQHGQVMDRLQRLTSTFQPKAMLLFASYVYFSHEENFFWNEHFWLSQVIEKLRPLVKIIVPKPNDVVDLQSLASTDFEQRNAEAIAFWTDLHNSCKPVDRVRQSETEEGLTAHFRAFHEALWRDNDLDYARKTARGPLDLTVRVNDLGKIVRLELLSGDIAWGVDEQWDVAISSETLAFLLKNKFGRGTLTINGRVEFHYPTAYKFFAFFFVYYANNIGRYLRPGDLSWQGLRSIEKTSVLDSIFHTTPGARDACRAHLDRFIAE